MSENNIGILVVEKNPKLHQVITSTFKGTLGKIVHAPTLKEADEVLRDEGEVRAIIIGGSFYAKSKEKTGPQALKRWIEEGLLEERKVEAVLASSMFDHNLGDYEEIAQEIKPQSAGIEVEEQPAGWLGEMKVVERSQSFEGYQWLKGILTNS